MPSAWPHICSPSDNCSNQAPGLYGMTTSTTSSKSQNVLLSKKLKKAYASSTLPNQHASPPTGLKPALASGCSKNIVSAQDSNHSAVMMAGKSPWLAAASLTQLSPGTPLLKERPWQSHGLYSARFFVLGCPTLIVGVDHKPLLQIFRDRALDDIDNTRLRNPKERTLRYRFQVTHIPGIKHKAADATSRHPVSEAIKLLLPDDVALLEDISDPLSRKEHRLAFLNAISIAETSPSYDDHESSLQQFTVAAINSLQSVTWTRVRLATASNDDMNQLLSIIESGMPNSRHQLPPNLQEYFQFRAHLSTIDGVITYKDRIVIPPCLRDTILSALHSAHSGVSSMLARAESSVFWPGITPAIHATRQNCSHCNRMAPSQPSAPPTPPVPSAYPFQCVCCDFFSHKGSTYLIFTLIGTLTGLSSNAHRMEQRGWSTASGVLSSLMAYQKNWSQMVDQNSNQTPSKASCAHGESTIGYHPSPSHTATVGLN